MFGQCFQNAVGGSSDGTLGFGFTATNPDGIDPPIINAINSGILDSPVVTMFLKSQEPDFPSSNSGLITYGAIDTVNCDRNVVYEPLTNNNFEIVLQNITLESNQSYGRWPAVIESGTRYIVMPVPIIEIVLQKLHATYNNSYGMFTIDCNAKFDFSFTVGSTSYSVTEKHMVTKYQGVCLLEVTGIQAHVWILGTPWFKAVCNVLDYGNKRIGFANIISS